MPLKAPVDEYAKNALDFGHSFTIRIFSFILYFFLGATLRASRWGGRIGSGLLVPPKTWMGSRPVWGSQAECSMVRGLSNKSNFTCKNGRFLMCSLLWDGGGVGPQLQALAMLPSWSVVVWIGSPCIRKPCFIGFFSESRGDGSVYIHIHALRFILSCLLWNYVAHVWALLSVSSPTM